MTNRIRILALVIVGILIGSTGLLAQNTGKLGVQFHKMPVGTQAYYKSSEGGSWTDVYAGVKRGKHIVNRYKGNRITGRKQSVRTFDANGRLLSFTGYGSRASKYTFKFKPYLCEFQIGSCKTTRRFSGAGYIHSGESESWIATTKREKNGYLTVYTKPRTGKPDGGTFFKLGKYNLRVLQSYGEETVKLVSLK